MRIELANPDTMDPAIKTVVDRGIQKWGEPLLTHLTYGHSTPIFKAVQAMWAGLSRSRLLDPTLPRLLNRRVAQINGCVF